MAEVQPTDVPLVARVLRPVPGARPVQPVAPPDPVLLVGNYRPTIALVRALGARGHRIVVGRGGGEGGAEYSRFVDEIWDHPPVEAGAEAFVAALVRFLAARPDVRVVFPVAEEYVRVVSAARPRLPADRVYAVPAPVVVAALLDKLGAYRLAGAAGVPVAPHALVETYEELRASCPALGYPVVVRPLDSTRRLSDSKAVIVTDAAALARRFPEWPPGQPALLVQRRVTGRRHNVYFAARAGRLVRLVEAVIERTDRPDDTGLATAGRTVPVTPRLRAYTEAIVAPLAYTGVGCAQFLVDDDRDAVWFLEVNPRIGGNHAIAEAAGLDLGVLSVVLAGPDPPDVPDVIGTPGIVYAWTYGDLRGLVSALRHRTVGAGAALRWLGGVARTLVEARVHMTWRTDDPLPAIALYLRRVPGLGRLLARRERVVGRRRLRVRPDEARR